MRLASNTIQYIKKKGVSNINRRVYIYSADVAVDCAAHIISRHCSPTSLSPLVSPCNSIFLQSQEKEALIDSDAK